MHSVYLMKNPILLRDVSESGGGTWWLECAGALYVLHQGDGKPVWVFFYTSGEGFRFEFLKEAGRLEFVLDVGTGVEGTFQSLRDRTCWRKEKAG